MKVNFFDFIFGCVGFTAYGEYPLRLMNQLAANGIRVWGIRQNGDCITAYMPLKSYKKIHGLRGRSGVRTRVTKRIGLPFLFYRYRFRAGLAAGVAVFFFTLYFLSSFIWNIEISAPEGIDKAEALSVCRELGLYDGVKKSSLDTEKLRTKIVLAVDGASWASVNISGIKATVNISKSIGEKEDKKEPCNLVASCDGIITAMEVRKGTAKVRIGQTVAKGELLVSGTTEYKDGSRSIGPSEGKITAVAEHTLTVSEKYTAVETVSDGKPFSRRVFTVFGLNIPLYLGGVDLDAKTAVSVKRQEKNGMYLPISVTEKIYYPVKEVATTRSLTETKEAAEKALANAEKAAFANAEILSRELIFKEADEGVVLTAKYRVSQDIAQEDLLLIYGEE